MNKQNSLKWIYKMYKKNLDRQEKTPAKENKSYNRQTLYVLQKRFINRSKYNFCMASSCALIYWENPV